MEAYQRNKICRTILKILESDTKLGEAMLLDKLQEKLGIDETRLEECTAELESNSHVKKMLNMTPRCLSIMITFPGRNAARDEASLEIKYPVYGKNDEGDFDFKGVLKKIKRSNHKYNGQIEQEIKKIQDQLKKRTPDVGAINISCKKLKDYACPEFTEQLFQYLRDQDILSDADR